MDQISQLIVAHPYEVLFPLAIVEGPIVSFIAGFLIWRGYLEPLPTILILILGDFIPDLVCYGIGRFGASWPVVKRYVEKIGGRGGHFEALRRLWALHPTKTMLFAKLAYGLSVPFLISAGLVGLPWRTFAALALMVTILERMVLIALGLYLGGYSQAVADTLQVAALIVAAGIIAAVVYYFLARYTRTRLLEEAKPQARRVPARMRVAIFTDIFLPQLSGVADSIEILAEELRRAGHETRIYAPRIAGAPEDPRVVRFASVLIPGSGGGLALVFPFGGLRDLKRFNPDLIHTQTFSTVGILAAYAAWRLKLPLVGTDHTFPAEYLRYVRLDFAPIRFLVDRAAAWYYSRCLFVTAPSAKMIEQLRSHGMTRPTEVISNPIRIDLFRPLERTADLKRKFGIGSEAILFFGRIAKEKNWDFALDVFAAVAARRDTELVVVGDGPYRREFEAKTRERPMGARCRFLGEMHGEQLVEAINACEVFLTTSMSETQSMSMLQASACGLPVVAVNSGGLPEYVRDGTTGYLVDPEDRDGLVDRVIDLLEDAQLRHRNGSNGREFAVQFSPAATTARHLAVYAAALAHGRPNGGREVS